MSAHYSRGDNGHQKHRGHMIVFNLPEPEGCDYHNKKQGWRAARGLDSQRVVQLVNKAWGA